MDSTLASASSVGMNNTLNPSKTSNMNKNASGGSLSLSLGGGSSSSGKDPQPSSSSSNQEFKKKTIKGGLTLIYDDEQEIEEMNDNEEKTTVTLERSMEERRSVSVRYSKIMISFWEKRKMELKQRQ